MTELLHEKGRVFVVELEYFLESTGNFEGIFTIYNSNDLTTREKLDNTPKRFDLVASYQKSVNELKIDVYIEAKNYNQQTNLKRHYKNFLIDCFSVWARMRKLSRTRKARFLFISTHPFSCSDFNGLKSFRYLKSLYNNFDDELKKIFDNYGSDIIINDFLEFVDILLLTESRKLISVNRKTLMKNFMK